MKKGMIMLFAAVISLKARAQQAIICLTYDDGLPSHLQTVIPQLDSAGLKATFFLNSIAGASTRIGEASPAVTGWRSAAARGHELGNHTLFHPCPRAVGWQAEMAIESYTMERLLSEIRAQEALLRALDTTRASRTYAYPCNNSLVGGKDYADMLQQKKIFSFARSGGDSTSPIADMKKLDPMKVPSWLVEEGTSLDALIRFADKASVAGGMAVYQFHGIGAEFFRVDAGTHRAFIRYLAAHPEKYRVLTFSEAMKDARIQK